MAKVYLKFKESVIREIPLSDGVTTIGRAEKHDIHIDNLAVSSNHARIIFENGKYIIEDTNSTNGTYINDRRITRQTLFHHAVITIGKHTLLFYDPEAVSPAPEQTVVHKQADSDATVVMTAAKQPPSEDQTIIKGAATATISPAAAETAAKVGFLAVIGGSAERSEYLLDKKLMTIGKADNAEIKLKGFFAPKVAAVINRTQDGYFITPASGEKMLLNGKPVSEASKLQRLDIIEVSSLRMQFSYKES